MSPVIVYIGVFFALLILAGWVLGLIPWKNGEIRLTDGNR